MSFPARRARLLRDLEDFLPDCYAVNLPSGYKRAAYTLERTAFRAGRIEQSLTKIARAIETVRRSVGMPLRDGGHRPPPYLP